MLLSKLYNRKKINVKTIRDSKRQIFQMKPSKYLKFKIKLENNTEGRGSRSSE